MALAAIIGATMGPGVAWARQTAAQHLEATVRAALEPQVVAGLPTSVLLCRPAGRGVVTIVVAVTWPAPRRGQWRERALTPGLANRIARIVADRLAATIPATDLSSASALVVRAPHDGGNGGQGQSRTVWLAPLTNAMERSRFPASPLHAETFLHGAPGAIDAPEPSAAPAQPLGSINAPLKQRRISLAETTRARQIEERLVEELTQLYPDPRVQVHPGPDPSQVDVFVIVRTSGASDDNSPFIRDYVRHVVSTVMDGEFPGVRQSRDSVVDIEEAQAPDADERAAHDNGDVRNRPSGADVGVSRRVEGAIMRELLPSFNDVRVEAYVVGSRDLEIFLWARTRGEIDDSNMDNLQEMVRQTIRTCIDRVAPGRRLSHMSKIRITSFGREASLAHRRVTREVGFSAPIQTLDGQLVEVPTAHVLRPHDRQMALAVRGHAIGPGVFSGVYAAKLLGISAEYREGLLPGSEFSVALSEQLETVAPTVVGTFGQGSLGLGALTVGLKVQWPFRNNGIELAFGGLVSLLSDMDRADFTPDEYENFSSMYVVWSTPFAPGWRFHAFGRQTHDAQAGLTPGSTMLSAGAALDFRPYEEFHVQGEIVRDMLGTATVGDFGSNLNFDGLHVNLRAVWGISQLGDVQVYARKINRLDDMELGAGLMWRI